MSRLFLSLFVLIVVVVLGFIFSLNGIIPRVIDGTVEDMREYQLGGIVRQLDDEIKELNSAQREERIRHIKSVFKYNVDLLPIDSAGFSDKEIQQIREGEFVATRYDIGETGYHLSNTDGLMWKLQVAPTLEEQDLDFIAGPLTLMTEKLAAIPKENWQQTIDEMDQKFGIPITLLSQNSTQVKQHLDKAQQIKLNAGEVIIFRHDDELRYIYFPIPDSQQVLKIGEIEYPLLLLSLNYLIFSVLALLIGLTIWLWLRPIWQDLRKLKQASEGVGQGQLDTRITISKYSSIKNILQAFNGMANQVEQLITSHKTLTNAVSHELRTPVSRLRFSLDMLDKTDSEADKTRHIQSMNTDIDELDDMLAELLNYARLDRQSIKLEKEAVVLTEWLKQQTQRWQQDCKPVALQITDANLPVAACECMNPKLMARVIHNLLQNACRYADQKIYVHFEYIDNHFLLSVEDDGCGIPKEHHDKVFDPFTRVDNSRNRNSGGYGLGLAIVKLIVNAHQGAVNIENSNLGGVKFLIRW